MREKKVHGAVFINVTPEINEQDVTPEILLLSYQVTESCVFWQNKALLSFSLLFFNAQKQYNLPSIACSQNYGLFGQETIFCPSYAQDSKCVLP